MQILQKKHHLPKYLFCHSTLGRYIHRICRIESNLYISPLVLFTRSCKIRRLYHHLLHFCSHHLMIWSNYWIAAIDLAAASSEVLLHWQPCLMVFSFLFLFFSNIFDPILLQQIYECLVKCGICAFLLNCSQEFPQNVFAIQGVIVIVKRITVKMN